MKAVDQDELDFVCKMHSDAIDELRKGLIIERSRLETQKLQNPEMPAWIQRREEDITNREACLKSLMLSFDQIGSFYQRSVENVNLLSRRLWDEHNDEYGF